MSRERLAMCGGPPVGWDGVAATKNAPGGPGGVWIGKPWCGAQTWADLLWTRYLDEKRARLVTCKTITGRRQTVTRFCVLLHIAYQILLIPGHSLGAERAREQALHHRVDAGATVQNRLDGGDDGHLD